MARTRRVSGSLVIDAPADRIFALLADPRRHPEIGSGMLRGVIVGPDRLSLGAHFGMSMRMAGFLPYKVDNEVVEFEENRRIAWRHSGKHVWRYELGPADSPAEGTLVTGTFDWNDAALRRVFDVTRVPRSNLRAINETLARIAERMRESPPGPDSADGPEDTDSPEDTDGPEGPDGR